MILLGAAAVLCFQSGSIPNGNFEDGLAHWPKATYGAEPHAEIDRSNGHGGHPSLKVSAIEATDTAFGQDISVHSGALYRYSAWVKTEGVKPLGAPVFGTIQAQTPGGASVIATGQNHGGTHDWIKESVVFQAPADGRARVALFLFGFGKGIGTAWFSDCQLEELNVEKASLKVTKKPLCPGRINPMQYGQFIEYLCDLVPSMWAEKLYDNSFEGLTPYVFRFNSLTDFKEKPWYPFGQANRVQVESDKTTSISGSVSKRLTVTEGAPATAGVAQEGIALQAGKACRFSLYAKSTASVSEIRVRLFHGSKEFASATVPVARNWKKSIVSLNPSGTTDEATLSITFRGPGTVWLDNASLMPVDNVGGWRPDVVKALTKLKPGVIRMGGSVLDDSNLGTFEWTDTVGDPDRRKPFQAWGGLQTMGAGLEEVVQLIQTVRAEPLICVRYEKKSPKDAADEVEYFNGAISTPMGALRAKNGHPKPYGIKFWQIGNERWGAAYWKAVPEFGRAMMAVDPTIKLLSSFPSEDLIKGAASELTYVSPHQYDVENLTGTKQELDDTRRMIREFGGGKNIRVAVTEWNTTAGDIGLPRAKLWTLKNALDCSRYQNLLHRQADLVEIANRSNLTNSFCSGIIQTNRAGMFLAPTYYAQKLYATFAGTVPLTVESEIPADMSPDVSATLSEDGHWLTLFAINTGPKAVTRRLDLSDLSSTGSAEVWTLADTTGAGEPDAFNSFGEPNRISPIKSRAVLSGGKGTYSFPAYSLTVIRIRTL